MPTGIFSEDRTSLCLKGHLRSFTVDKKSNLFLTFGHSKILHRPLSIVHFRSSIFEGSTEWFLSKCHLRTYPSDITVLFIFIFNLVNELIVTVMECSLLILFLLQSELQFELQFELQLVTVCERLFFSCQSLMDGINSGHFPVHVCADLYEFFMVNFPRTYAGRLMMNEKWMIYL